MKPSAGARPGPVLDHAQRAGDTVGALAADALVLCADIFESVESNDAGVRARLEDKARVARKLIGPMRLSPLSNVSRVLAPSDLGGPR